MCPKGLSKKLWIIISCFVLVIVTALACLVPFPISDKLTFHGVEVAADGMVLKECEFTVGYTKLNYLFQEDGYSEFALDVDGMHFDIASYSDLLKIDTLPDTEHDWVELFCYNEQANGFGDRATVCCGKNWEWCFVKTQILNENGARYFVGYLEGNSDYRNILDQCSCFLN